jgi:hypothetical protein
MKRLLLLSTLLICAFSCENEDNIVAAQAKVIGEWEVYKVEKQYLVLDFVNGEMVQSMEWYDLTPSAEPEPSLIFDNDNTFETSYAGVITGEGVWSEIDENSFSFTFNQNLWSSLESNYIVQFDCDNTMSIKYLVEPPAGNHDFQDSDWYLVQYFRTPETVECDDLVNYYVYD